MGVGYCSFERPPREENSRLDRVCNRLVYTGNIQVSSLATNCRLEIEGKVRNK